MITSGMNIYPDRERGTYKFYAVQGEAMGRELVLNLFDQNGQEVNLTKSRIFLYVSKQDRNVAVVEGKTGDGLQNTVHCKLTYQTCTCPGVCNMLLQVITEDGELRYDNMELTVSPTETDAIFESTTDIGPLAKIIKNGDQIAREMENITTIRELMVSVLKNYADSISADIIGTLPVEDEQFYTSTVAADINGSILMLDTNSWGASETYFSCDEGRTWEKKGLQGAEVEGQDLFHVCVGGNYFLCVGRDKMIWVKIANGVMTIESTKDITFKTGVTPAVSHGQYVNGRYFLFRQNNIATSEAFSPVYFTGPGSAPAYIALPASNMVAGSIAFSDGYWYMTAYETWHDDNKPHKAWLLRSETLANWAAIAQWEGNHNEYKFFTIREGVATVYGDSQNGMKVKRIDLATNAVTEKWIRNGQGFNPETAVASELFDVVLSGNEICYTKDGKDYKFFDTSFKDNWDFSVDIAIPLRRLIVADGAYYAIYRLDMLGENLSEKLNEAKAQYEDLVELAKRKANEIDSLIKISSVKMEEGDELEAGHIYIWYTT